MFLQSGEESNAVGVRYYPCFKLTYFKGEIKSEKCFAQSMLQFLIRILRNAFLHFAPSIIILLKLTQIHFGGVLVSERNAILADCDLELQN